MSIPISFITAVVKKSAVRKLYPAGIDGFRRDFPGAREDAYLFGLASMPGGEFQEILDRLTSAGLDLAHCCAIGEMFSGEDEACPGIKFSQTVQWPPRWEAQLIWDDPEVMAEEGARLVGWMMAKGWVLDIPRGTP